MCIARWPRRRTAFTLIELLVVISLILVIFGLGAGYVVFGQEGQHSTTAANKVTGALLVTRQIARRDGLPTGIRLIFGTNGAQPTHASEFQLIQQPEDYSAGQITANNIASNTVSFTQTDFQGGAKYMGEIDESTVQIGDYFTLSGIQSPHRITNIAGPVGGETLTLASTIGPVAPGAPYSILRAPRRMPSEEAVQLPPTMVIENGAIPGNAGTFCQNLPQRTLVDSSTSTTVAEIVFGPSGAVIGQGTGSDKVLLWLRDPSLPNATSGSPVIVSIQIRTGFISVHAVAPWNFGTAIGPNNDPYANAKSGRASGM